MAHLNLRDRVIEATIAYIAADALLGRRNLEQVQRDSQRGRSGMLAEVAFPEGSWVALDWRPREGPMLNDCELRVKLIAPHTPLDATLVARALADADGIVVALRGGALAGPENAATLTTVRDALARMGKRDLPVLVQIDQSPGLGESAGNAAVTEDWPQMSACTTKGEGVMETLERAVAGVMDSLQNRDAEATAPRPPGGPSSPRVEGNPLLGALRQIMQAIVSENVLRLEDRLAQRLTSLQKTSDDASRLQDSRLAAAVDQLDALGARIDALGLQLQHDSGDAARRLVEMRDALRALVDKPDAPAESIRTELATLVEELRDKTKHWFT